MKPTRRTAALLILAFVVVPLCGIFWLETWSVAKYPAPEPKFDPIILNLAKKSAFITFGLSMMCGLIDLFKGVQQRFPLRKELRDASVDQIRIWMNPLNGRSNSSTRNIAPETDSALIYVYGVAGTTEAMVAATAERTFST